MASTTLKSNDGRDTYAIRNFNPNLFLGEFNAKERTTFVKAGVRAQLPIDEDALHAAARALATLPEATEQIRADILSTEHVGRTTIHTIDGHVYLGELLPLFQPRGAALYEADNLQARGSLDAAENPLAMTTLTFRDETHLKTHVRNVIERTLALGRDYSASILTKKVTNPVLAEAVRIEFEDGAEGFTAMAVRDGVSRVISSWKVIYPSSESFEFPDLVATHVLASKWVRGGSASASRAKGRYESRTALRVEAVRGMADGQPNEATIRIQQAYTMPARIVAGYPNPIEDFEETMRELVAVSNGESRPWSLDQRNEDALERAIRRAVREGQMSPVVRDLLVGLFTIEVQETYWPRLGVDPLRRNVAVIGELMKAGTRGTLKEHLAEVTGRSHISDEAYVRFMMPLIDAPWRGVKGRAVAAWADGGPIPLGVDWDAWHPIMISDFRVLVPRALEGDVDARVTLQVAGGIALAADRLLVGKSLEGAPFSADVPTVLDGLGGSAAGLWLLARAANAFDSRKMAWNALPISKKSSLQAVDTYIVPTPNFREPEQLLDANAGQGHRLARPVPLLANDVVAFSDPHRGGIELDGPEAEAWRPSAGELRDKVLGKLMGALSGLGELEELLDDGGLQVPPLLGDEWERAHGIVSELQALVWRSKPQQ
jgi:hypothetical protein